MAILAWCSLLVGLAQADDGWVGNSGAPVYLRGSHPTISMTDEVVKMAIGKDYTVVDCVFHFYNRGRATTVQMGFPDEMPREEGEHWTTVFDNFRTWIDGKEAKTRFQVDSDGGGWQIKTVRFPAHSRRTVRDRYVVRIGSQGQGGDTYLYNAAYTLSTGKSWRGPIGSIRVEVRFDPKFFRAERLKRLDRKEVDKRGDPDDSTKDYLAFQHKYFARHKHTVFWESLIHPKFVNGVVVFFARNHKPKKSSNINLEFRPYTADSPEGVKLLYGGKKH